MKLAPHLALLACIALTLALLVLCGPRAHGEDGDGRWMQVQASAYCPCAICCGVRAAGITATGVHVSSQPYGIAAHPGYLPYGSRITIPAGLGYLDRSPFPLTCQRHSMGRALPLDLRGDSMTKTGFLYVFLPMCAIVLVPLGAWAGWAWYRSGVQAEVYERQGIHMATWEVFIGTHPTVRVTPAP